MHDDMTSATFCHEWHDVMLIPGALDFSFRPLLTGLCGVLLILQGECARPLCGSKVYVEERNCMIAMVMLQQNLEHCTLALKRNEFAVLISVGNAHGEKPVSLVSQPCVCSSSIQFSQCSHYWR
jgi:hypothetical protein